MKYFLDEQGNVVEKPETLQENLRQKSPELADRLVNITNKIALLKMYQFFLYNHPTEEELNLPEKRGPNWEKFIEVVGSQQGLEKTIDMLESLKNDKLDVQDDKVVVVRSDRPFWDTLLNKEHILGKCEGWIGEVESHDITDIPDAKFYSQDGKIYQRFVLQNAKRLTKKELREFASSAQLVMMNHHYSDPARSFSDRMKGKKLGDKRVVIYDEYQKVDYFIADHKLSDIEKQVADISYEEARWIPLKPFYGEKQIPASRVTIGRSYPKDNSTYSESVLTAEDPRTILEIWQQIQEPLEAFAKERLDGNSDLKEIGIKLVRHVKDFLTPEQREFAKNAPGGDDVKWFKKYVTEQGLEVTNATTIIVSPHVGSAYDADIREEVIDLLEKHLPKYKKDKAYISCSLGGYVDELKAETTYDFVWDAELYVGESIDIDRYYFVNQAREAQRLEERMRRFGKK